MLRSTPAPVPRRPAAWHQLDVRDPAQVEALLVTVAPRAVINVTSGGADWAITADGSIHIAMATAKLGIRLVHVSSDAVFSGIGKARYDETCTPDPITPYGAAKAAAETAVRLLCPDGIVVRTSLIIGDGGSHHERVVHELAAKEREGALFTDDIRCPVHVADLAAGLWKLAASNEAGVFHLASTPTPSAATRWACSSPAATASHPPCCPRAVGRTPGYRGHWTYASTAAPRDTGWASGSAAPGSSSIRGNTRWPTPARSGVTCCQRLLPRPARTGEKERSCCDGERGFHPLPCSEDGLVRVRLQVSVALGGLEALVAQEVLDLVERDSLLDQPRGAGVTHGVRRVVRDE